MIKACKINHHGEDRLKLDFPFNAAISNQIKQVKGSAWSRTRGAWHVPFTKEAFEELKKKFPDIVLPLLQEKKVEPIEIKPVITKPTEIKPPAQSIKDDKNRIKIEVIGRKIILKMPKNDADVKFINTLKYSRWDGRMFYWEIPNYPGNLDLINDHFKDRINELVIHDKFDISLSNETRTIGNKELLIIKTKTGRLRLIFGFNNALRLLIKKYPYNSWDAKNKWWTIPYSEIYLNEIQSHALEEGMKVSYEEESAGDKGVKRISAFDVPNYRECPAEMILKLKEIRYSEKTIKTYKGLFEEFINYYHKYDINKIDESQIISFLRFLVMERKVSTSYQNQSINAIKFYYEKVLGGQRKFYFIDRPKAAVKKAGIQQHTTMHTLRHTFATHSLENGVDLRYIQSMMGHDSSKTTEIYTHITTKGFDQIKSPLDNLDI